VAEKPAHRRTPLTGRGSRTGERSATIAGIARDVIDGKDVPENIRRLKPRAREAIAHFVSILEGKAPFAPSPGVDLRDAYEQVTNAICALGADDPGHLADLLRAALRTGAHQPAFSLAWGLAHMDAKEAVEPLVLAMGHRDEYVRWAACIGLRRRRVARARPLLVEAAAARSSVVRHEAVIALRSLGDETALPVLKKRLADRYPGIRDAAAEAIDAIEARRRLSRAAADRSEG
jgi:HEAT repeat protein